MIHHSLLHCRKMNGGSLFIAALQHEAGSLELVGFWLKAPRVGPGAAAECARWGRKQFLFFLQTAQHILHNIIFPNIISSIRRCFAEPSVSIPCACERMV